MHKDQVSAEEVLKAVMGRISMGQYAPGDRLPPVRVMASEIGSNRNTVNKAYQMLLDMGMVEYSNNKRKGFTVLRSDFGGQKSRSELLEYFQRHSVEIIWQAMAAGMTSDEILEQLKSAMNEVLSNLDVRLIFFECNDYDTIEMGRSLNKTLKIPVDYMNLSQFYLDPRKVIQSYDILVTTYHHLAEVTACLDQHGFSDDCLVGIETRLTPESMLKIARFSKANIGVICTNQNTAHMLKHILYGYHPEWTVEATEMANSEKVISLGKTSDHIIASHTCVDVVMELTGRSPDVIANFQIDEQSITFLNERILQIRMKKIGQGGPLNPVETAGNLMDAG